MLMILLIRNLYGVLECNRFESQLNAITDVRTYCDDPVKLRN
ncbi:hypothetical protein HanIR_Chr11g0546341 [Helianthus annuus]|nr:hypothetical protein HanIR_Chr11g0546341 [Helianthus annuus]